MTKLWTPGAERPQNPCLEQLKKQAKELVKAHASRAPEALAFLCAHHPRFAGAPDGEIAAFPLKRSDAQWAIARFLGEPSWPALVRRMEGGKLLPLLPVRGVVVFPGQRLPLHVGRPRSIRTVEAAQRDDGSIAMVAQRLSSQEEPGLSDLHPIGTLGRILPERGRQPAQGLQIIVEGRRRIRLEQIEERDGLLLGRVQVLDAEEVVVDPEIARRSAIIALEAVVRQLQEVPQVSEARALMLPHMRLLPPAVQQQILETDDPAAWLRALLESLRTGI